MKKFINYFMIAMLATAVAFTGCKDNDDTTPAEKGNFKTLSEYMVNNDLDLPTVLSTPTNWVVAPALIDGTTGNVDPADYSIPAYHVFDIRSATDFETGHVKGAINVALADVVTKAAEVGTDKPIMVICYSGQTAGRAVMALRLSGYKDAQVMKFGMSYWNTDFDKWSGKVSDIADGNANWEIDASSPSLPLNDFPVWETTSTDGATILASAVDAMLAIPSSDWLVTSTEVLNDPLAYNIYNFWDEATYLSLGHYKGAYQYGLISLNDDLVSALPAEDDFLIYCYTGQTSSIATAWLQVLGYHAKSIGYGVNSLRHTALEEAGKPAWHASKDFPYETGK